MPDTILNQGYTVDNLQFKLYMKNGTSMYSTARDFTEACSTGNIWLCSAIANPDTSADNIGYVIFYDKNDLSNFSGQFTVESVRSISDAICP